MNCPIRERTGDGRSVGRCCFHCPDGVCPRHGDVAIPIARFEATATLTDENDWPLRWLRLTPDTWTATLSGHGPHRWPDIRMVRRRGWYFLETFQVTSHTWIYLRTEKGTPLRFVSREDAVEAAIDRWRRVGWKRPTS